MDWISLVSTGIAITRLILIVAGMWMLLRYVSKGGSSNFQHVAFADAGMFYLLGLLPHTLMLFQYNSDLVNFIIDKGYLCSWQNIACMFAVALHNLITLKWIVDNINHRNIFSSGRFVSMFRRKYINVLLAVYIVAFFVGRSTFLQQGDEQKYYADLAFKPDKSVDGVSWTTTQIVHPSNVLQLQLLLCESSLSAENVPWFIGVSFAFLILPFVLLSLCLKSKLNDRKKDYTGLAVNIPQDLEMKDEQHWLENEDNLQRILSTFISIWFHAIQPFIFCAYRQNFVDFGTHLLLTICVFVPWTLLEKKQEQKGWV